MLLAQGADGRGVPDPDGDPLGAPDPDLLLPPHPTAARQEAERGAKLAALKKNDRIVTVGGIYGVVTMQRDIDEVTIKVDEASNTKLRVTLGSIARVLGDGPSDGPSSK